MSRELAIKLHKNKIDLRHKVLLQRQQVILAFLVGFPITMANLVISFNLHTNKDAMLYVIPFFAIVFSLFNRFREENLQKLHTIEDEIDGLLRNI